MLHAVPSELFEFMAPYPHEVLETMLAIRKVVLVAAPDATEILVDATNAVAFGYTYTHSYVQGFIHIAAYSKHVNLGFNQGTSLTDPEGRLTGVGTRVRHVSLATASASADPYLRDLIEEAERNAFRPTKTLEPKQIVTVMKGARRRPRSL